MRKLLAILAAVPCVAGVAAAADDDILLLQPPTEDIVLAPVAGPTRPLLPTAAGPTNLLLAAGTEAEVVEGTLGTGFVHVKLASGAQVWVAAGSVSGSGRLRTPGAADDSSGKVAAFRAEADFRKAQNADGSASSAFMGIMSDEQVMLLQKTRVTLIPNGTKLPGAALIQILDDGPRKNARLFVALENVTLEGKIRIGAAGGKSVTGFASRPALAGGGEGGRK
jgi:hypothetical protein